MTRNLLLEKHLRLYHGNDEDIIREAPGKPNNDLFSWTDRLYETRHRCVGLILMAFFLFRMPKDVQLTLAISTKITIAFTILLGSMGIFTAYHQMEQQRIRRAQAVQRAIFLKISELLGSIGAPVIGHSIDAPDQVSFGLFRWDKDDANTFVSFVEAESESILSISSAIQTIEMLTRFMYRAAMTSTRPTNVLPNLRYQVHSLLRVKRKNLEHLRKSLALDLEESSIGEDHCVANSVDVAVITVSLLRDMLKQSVRLLSNICEIVLCTNATSQVSFQVSLLRRLHLEAEGVAASLKQAIKTTTSSERAECNAYDHEIISLQDMASSLHLALVSLHQQQTACKDSSSKALSLQQWKTTLQQSRLLTERLDDLLVTMTTTYGGDTMNQDLSESPTDDVLTSEFYDDNAGNNMCPRLPSLVAPAGETLVFSDVAAKRQRPKPEINRMCEPSPFAFVEELQSRLKMMAVEEQ